jgi:predicted 2-oxoglutarate/Fe(II)-dependent dioxygenase YbiX
MISIAVDFAETLSRVRRPSGFCVAGTEQMLAPGLAVEGIGPVALPLLAMQAEQLIAVAERAPYGRGSETITDIAVRRTWQIAADRVRITGRQWPDTLQAIVARVAAGLGVDEPVEAEFYKLLIYDTGSFFVPHRDTEKVAGMFATLVLALPSVSEGGALIVRHKDRSERLELHCEDASEVAFAAFYADCVHEVLPVTGGYRLVLVYNLLRPGSRTLPAVPDYAAETAALTGLLQASAAEPRLAEPRFEEPGLAEPDLAEPGETDDDLDVEDDDADDNDDDDVDLDDAGPDADAVPEKLIYPLEHAYTAAELGFGALKGADAAVAPVVVAAAERAGCAVHLALVSVEESGVAQYNGDYRSYRRGRYRDEEDDDDEGGDADFEVVEVSERTAIASEWRRPDGEPSPLTELPVMQQEFSPPVDFEDLEPDEQHFHEATGNEGASFERSYSRAALILWPHDRLLAVIAQGGRGVTLPLLADLADRWKAGGDPAVRAEASALSALILADWSMDRWYRSCDGGVTDAGRFLDLLRRLDDTGRLQAFLDRLAVRGGFDLGDAAAIGDALLALPPGPAAALAVRLVEGAAAPALAACARLLLRVSASNPRLGVDAGRVLVAALPGGAKRPAGPGFYCDPGVQPACIADLFTALGRIDTTLAAVSADHVLDWPATYDFDTVLIPALTTLLGAPETAGQPTVQRLKAASLAHLEARIALPLEPPGDWRRDNTLGCACRDCAALAVFLADAGQPVWVFAAAEARRRHVQATITAARCDVDTATERRGSPHKLICTKNQASYKRRCEQRANDLAERARLAGAG